MTKDNDLFSKSIKYIEKCFAPDYNQSEEVLVLSISRKGPKLLEKIFGRKPRQHYNTITEVALPYCMRRLSKENRELTVKIFDDAIYFGTTVESIYNELKAFEQLYGIHSEKKLYTAIRAPESRNDLRKCLSGVEIHSYNDDNEESVRAGYGHYFVREFEKYVSESNNTLEIEFPIVEFDSDEEVNRDALFNELRNIYSEKNTYLVKHHDQSSLTVLFENLPGQSFRKLRIYVDGKTIRVVSMSPWLLPNDMSVLLGMFFGTSWEPLWEELTNAYFVLVTEEREFNFHAFQQVERSIRKSLVIMANYILSFELMRAESNNLTRVFRKLGGAVHFRGVLITDLFYLLGDISLCNAVKNQIDQAWGDFEIHQNSSPETPNMSPLSLNVDYQVFENEHFLGADELFAFQQQNEKMLLKSINESEALSALFFNQTAMIEKWSRRDKKYAFGRLRFGYTFTSLLKDLQTKFSNKQVQEVQKKMHRWVDHRIDQACVVPQYVIDHETNTWCRVFRPGENEDALLNHLARLVLMVFNCIDSKLNLGWVRETLLKEMLCLVVTDDNKKDINDSFDFNLIPDCSNRVLFYRVDGEDDKRDVYEYMKDMGILTEKNGMVSIGKELKDEEIAKSTTLDEELENSIKERISSIAENVVSYSSVYAPTFVTNLYFFKKDNLGDMQRVNQDAIRVLNKIVAHLEKSGNLDGNNQDLFHSYYSARQLIVSIPFFSKLETLSLLPLDSDSERGCYAKEMIVMWRQKITFELIIAAFLQENMTMLDSHIGVNPMNYMAYGCFLGLDMNSQAALDNLLKNTRDLPSVRRQIVPIIKQHLERISNVNLTLS